MDRSLFFSKASSIPHHAISTKKSEQESKSIQIEKSKKKKKDPRVTEVVQPCIVKLLLRSQSLNISGAWMKDQNQRECTFTLLC